MNKKNVSVLIALFVILITVLPTAAQESLDGNAQFYYLRALQFLRAGDYAQAAENFQNAAIKDPSNAHFHIKAAYCLMELGRNEEAFTEANEAMRLNSQSVDNTLELIYILERLEHHEEALEVSEHLTSEGYRAVNQEFGWFAIAQYNTAYSLLRLERYNEAKDHIDEALRFSPSNVAMNVLLGDIYLRMNDPQEAIKIYRHSTQMDPESGGAWRGLCVAANRLGLFEESITAYETAAELEGVEDNLLESAITAEELSDAYHASLDETSLLSNEVATEDENK